SLSAFDTWWLELLQTGVLAGADPLKPNHARSNRYEEEREVGTDGYGSNRTHTVWRDGLYDQARRISPKLKSASDTALGRYLGEQACNDCWVRRRRGWLFPPLKGMQRTLAQPLPRNHLARPKNNGMDDRRRLMARGTREPLCYCRFVRPVDRPC